MSVLDYAALLDALAVDGFRRIEEGLAQAAELDNPTFVSRLTDVAVAYVRFATDNPALLDLMLTHKHQAYASDEVRQATYTSITRVNALVELGQSTEELVDGDLESIAFVLFATLQGIASLANTQMIDTMTLDKLTAYAVNPLLGGLTTLPKPTRCE